VTTLPREPGSSVGHPFFFWSDDSERTHRVARCPLSRRAAELSSAMASLILDAEDRNALAGEVQRINSRLADAEERIVGGGGRPWSEVCRVSA